MDCHVRYRVCVDPGYTVSCACGRDKVGLVEGVYVELRGIYERYRDGIIRLVQRYGDRLCLLKQPVIDELGRIVKCFKGGRDDSFLKRNCPSHILCDEEYIARLYRDNGFTFRNPDVLIVKGSNVTLIVEEKSYGKQSFQRFTEQITGEYMHLPEELRSYCTFIVYAPKGRGTLPRGLKRDSRYGLLVYERSVRRGSISLFDVPVFVYYRSWW